MGPISVCTLSCAVAAVTYADPACSLTMVEERNQVDRSDHAATFSPTIEFDEYYRNDYRSLLGLALVLTSSRAVAEDLCQDALTEAHRKWASVRHYDDPGAWVRRVLVNKSRSRFRRVTSEAKALTRLGSRPNSGSSVLVSSVAATASPGPDMSSDQAMDVWAAVRKLPQRQAQAVALFYWEDRTVAQIAEILDCGLETVKTHLTRGRAALTRTLGDNAGADGGQELGAGGER